MRTASCRMFTQCCTHCTAKLDLKTLVNPSTPSHSSHHPSPVLIVSAAALKSHLTWEEICDLAHCSIISGFYHNGFQRLHNPAFPLVLNQYYEVLAGNLLSSPCSGFCRNNLCKGLLRTDLKCIKCHVFMI